MEELTARNRRPCSEGEVEEAGENEEERRESVDLRRARRGVVIVAVVKEVVEEQVVVKEVVEEQVVEEGKYFIADLGVAPHWQRR